MQTWNILAEGAQRVAEQNRFIFLIVFTARVIVIKMSKMTLSVFSSEDSKNLFKNCLHI